MQMLRRQMLAKIIEAVACGSLYLGYRRDYVCIVKANESVWDAMLLPGMKILIIIVCMLRRTATRSVMSIECCTHKWSGCSHVLVLAAWCTSGHVLHSCCEAYNPHRTAIGFAFSYDEADSRNIRYCGRAMSNVPCVVIAAQDRPHCLIWPSFRVNLQAGLWKDRNSGTVLHVTVALF